MFIFTFSADPKSSQTSKLITDFKRQPMATLKRRAKDKISLTRGNTNEEECMQHLGKMPYQCDTVFGYVTLVDPEMNVKETIYGQPPYNSIAKLDEGELKILDLMIEGKFYSHTGNVLNNIRKKFCSCFSFQIKKN